MCWEECLPQEVKKEQWCRVDKSNTKKTSYVNHACLAYRQDYRTYGDEYGEKNKYSKVVSALSANHHKKCHAV